MGHVNVIFLVVYTNEIDKIVRYTTFCFIMSSHVFLGGGLLYSHEKRNIINIEIHGLSCLTRVEITDDTMY